MVSPLINANGIFHACRNLVLIVAAVQITLILVTDSDVHKLMAHFDSFERHHDSSKLKNATPVSSSSIGSGNDSEDRSTMVRLPNIQLIGAQKAGTTAIAGFLYEQAGVCSPFTFDNEPAYFSKEVHFFDQSSRYDQGVEFYARRFQHCADSQHLLDATPNTLGFAERVRKAYEEAGGDQLQELKIIVILREPVARELSLFNHMKSEYTRLQALEGAWYNAVAKADGTPMTFTEYAESVTIDKWLKDGEYHASYFGTYASHLRKWFQIVDREQILVTSYNELKENPETFASRLIKFLDLEVDAAASMFRQSNSQSSSSKTKVPTCSALQSLAAAFSPLNDELYKLLEQNEGPSVEQRPFPRFELPDCTEEN